MSVTIAFGKLPKEALHILYTALIHCMHSLKEITSTSCMLHKLGIFELVIL